VLTYWPSDDTVEWLPPTDMLMAIGATTLRRDGGARPRVAEIGVWKGGWLLTLLANVDATGVGVDPYEDQGWPVSARHSPQAVRERVIGRIADMGLGDRVDLYRSRAEVCDAHCGGSEHVRFDLIHIDGDHSEAGVEADLEWAARHLEPRGVIVADDLHHPYFPGIASAVYRFLPAADFAMFLSTQQKAYLCRGGEHAAWGAAFEEFLTGRDLNWLRHGGYTDTSQVGGRSVLLCLGGGNDDAALRSGYWRLGRLLRASPGSPYWRLARIAGRRLGRVGAAARATRAGRRSAG
jgi:hypothetical protein